MALKTFNPTSPGRRQLVLVDRSALHKGDPVKALTEGLNKKGGRNNQGRITVRHQGGGAKRLYRKVDFKRNRWDVPAVVERLEYDPNRTAFIALIKYEDGLLSYIIAPQRLEVGDTVITSATADIKPGNTLPLKSIPVGTIIHNIELKPQKGAQMVRSAGTYAQLVGRDSGYAQIKLASGEFQLSGGHLNGSVNFKTQNSFEFTMDGSYRIVEGFGSFYWQGKQYEGILERGYSLNP